MKVERCPDQHRVSREYVASLEPDRICFHCTEKKDDDVCWLFSQIKGFQYKSDFGHLIVDTSRCVCVCERECVCVRVTPRVVGTPSKKGRLPPTRDLPVWVASSNKTMQRPEKKVAEMSDSEW